MPAAAGAWPFERPLTIDDLGELELPEIFKYELWDGVLMATPRPTAWHQELARRFCAQANAQLSRVWLACQEIMVEFDPIRALQPDAIIVRTEFLRPRARYPFPADVAAVLEVASASTARYDRTTKRDRYAAAGVPVYVRIEPNKLDAPVVVVDVLADDRYVEVARSEPGTGVLTVPGPEPFTIDVAALGVVEE